MICLLVFDVDGTLTDGRIYMGTDGEAMKSFDAKDGYGIAHLLPAMGVTPVIITGRTSRILQRRATELRITELHQGVADKLTELKAIMAERRLTADEVAFIGDDLNDLEGIRYAGVSGCPADAVREVREAVDYVCTHEGGRGAAREFIEWIAVRNANETGCSDSRR